MNPKIILNGQDLYKDDSLLVVNKPAGLLSVPGRGADKQDCLFLRLKTAYPQVLVVHRLDQATSGLMIFALNKEIQAALGCQFENRQIRKEYEALLEGKVARKGKITLKQRLDVENRPCQIIDDENGKEGVTRWKRLSLKKVEAGLLSRVRFYPLTGRTHQLRLLAKELGAPIEGDTLYGPGAPLSSQLVNRRMMLHSSRIEFIHPLSHKQMVFTSRAPF